MMDAVIKFMGSPNVRQLRDQRSEEMEIRCSDLFKQSQKPTGDEVVEPQPKPEDKLTARDPVAVDHSWQKFWAKVFRHAASSTKADHLLDLCL
jgi:hypothetical protein